MRDVLKKIGLVVDEGFNQFTWQLWVSAANVDEPQTRILQSNGTNPRVNDFSQGGTTWFDPEQTAAPGVTPRYICRIWHAPDIASTMSTKSWYWLSKDEGQTFEKLRPLVIRDGVGPQNLLIVIVLGETQIKR